MALLRLQVRNQVRDQQFRIDLEGQSFGFRFTYNARGESWQMHVDDFEGIRIVSTTLRSGVDLLGRFRLANAPLGTLTIFDNLGEYTDPTLTSLGDRHTLLYLESTGL